MSRRATFGTLLVVLVLVLPLPLLGPFDALVPVVRFVLLLGASSAVAIQEGAAGPVPMIVLLFAAHAVVGLVACVLLASLATGGLSHLAPGTRRVLVGVFVFGAVILASVFDFYQTPFGRAPESNLWGLFH
ncbi:MAG: hypothetical protein VX574_10785 [Myxococcota bacterium]|nr:hypothetical protein [Myxococcota bacterium]